MNITEKRQLVKLLNKLLDEAASTIVTAENMRLKPLFKKRQTALARSIARQKTKIDRILKIREEPLKSVTEYDTGLSYIKFLQSDKFKSDPLHFPLNEDSDTGKPKKHDVIREAKNRKQAFLLNRINQTMITK